MKKAFSGGALILAEMDEKEFSGPINADIVKKYYAWGNREKWLAKVENPKRRLDYGKEVLRLKIRKGGLGNESQLGHAKNKISTITKVSLVRGRAESEICSEGIKDIN